MQKNYNNLEHKEQKQQLFSSQPFQPTNMNNYRRGSTFINACALFSLSHVHCCLAPHGLRAHGKNVESRTCTVSSRVKPATHYSQTMTKKERMDEIHAKCE